MKQAFIMTLLAVVGCATPVEMEGYVLVDATEQAQEVLPQPWVFENRVMDAELLPFVEAGADRWRQASCIDIRVGDTGYPWSLVPFIREYEKDGRTLTVSGRTSVDGVIILASHAYKDVTVDHEFGHALGVVHMDADPNLMNSVIDELDIGRRNIITESVLTELCVIRECGCFNPEPIPLQFVLDGALPPAR